MHLVNMPTPSRSLFQLSKWSEIVRDMQQILPLILKKLTTVISHPMGTHHSHLVSSTSIICPHGVCYGFVVMHTCESPGIPFQIFTSQFQTPPQSIFMTMDANCMFTASTLQGDLILR